MNIFFLVYKKIVVWETGGWSDTIAKIWNLFIILSLLQFQKWQESLTPKNTKCSEAN